MIGAKLYDSYNSMVLGKSGARAPVIALVIVACITALYFVLRPANVTEESLAAVEQES
jgi:hypothetical protein